MRPNRGGLSRARAIAAAVFILCNVAMAADELAEDAPANRKSAIIAAVHAQEARYRDVEYVVKITTRTADQGSADRAPELTSLETRHVVLQGDRIFFSKREHERVLATKTAREEISAYDGVRTRTVVAGNCVNVHLGRFELAGACPAHSLALAHFLVNLPLSVYLGGTEAIAAHANSPRFEREFGSVYEFSAVITGLEGEEMVDGLRCVKVRVDRSPYSHREPSLQHLWLAADRNYFCVKERLLSSTRTPGGLPAREMHVDEMRELAPGLWFPMKLTVVNYDAQALKQNKQIVSSQSEMIVDKVDLAPHHEDAFFHDVPIPAGLPVFTIKDRVLVDSALSEPVGGEAGKLKLAEVVAQVAEQEKRYSDLEVNVQVTYTSTNPTMRVGNIITNYTHEEHSILRGKSAYRSMRNEFMTLGGKRSVQFQVRASDGKWTRSLDRSTLGDTDVPLNASLSKSGVERVDDLDCRVPVYRPHMFLLRYGHTNGPLADLLVSPWRDRVKKYRSRFHYCGEAFVDGHPCIKLRGDVMIEGRDQPTSSVVLYLATDWNHIPIKLEHYGGNSGRSDLPAGVSRCDDFREIAPGAWFPFHVSEVMFDDFMSRAQGRIVIKWRRDYQIESAKLSPKVDDAVFHEVNVPEGTKVLVFDEDGTFLGEFNQPQDGVAAIAPARLLELRSQAELTEEEVRDRKKAIAAMLGKPAPEFPQGAEWLGSKPLTWESLRGEVVILEFWAEWSEACRSELQKLKVVHDARDSNGLTVIGIHPPGSPRELIKKVIDELHLDFPTCVDVPAQRGVKAWGDLFGRFAAGAVPQAVAVDRMGRVVACGGLEDVRAEARKLIAKDR